MTCFLTSSTTSPHKAMPLPQHNHRPRPQDFGIDAWNRLQELPKLAENAFLFAVYDDDVPRLRALIGGGNPNINHCDATFGSALDLAVRCDDVTAVDILLEAGAKPWATSGFSHPETSPLIAAIESGNSFLFPRLCRYARLGDDENSRRRYRSMLLKAASGGQANIVEAILSCCPEETMPRFPEPVSISILRRAAAERHAQVVRLALDRFTYSAVDLDSALRGAADLPANLLDGPPRGAFPSLEYLHQQQVIGLLIDAGADPNRCRHIVNRAATYIDLVGALQTLLERGADPNERRGDKGATALHRLGSPVYVGRGPARYCHETGIRILLDHGARVLERDAEGNTALHYAAFGSNLQIFRLLVSKLPPDMDASIISLRNHSGEALLHWAAAGKKHDIVRYLLSAGADVNCANDNGWTPLLCAVAPSMAIYQLYDVAETATLLLEQAADPLVCSAESWTPLLCVAAHLDPEEDSLLADVAANLVARGASIAQRAVMLPVSAHHGRRSARPDTLDVGLWGSRLAGHLLTASQEGSGGAVVVNDATPLHWAALYGAVGTAAVLKAHGADARARDANGNRPVDLASQSHCLDQHAQALSRLLHLLAIEVTADE